MKKRLISLVLALLLLCSLLCACGKADITANDAVTIVMEQLGDDAANVGTPHVHTGKFGNEDCYNVYITLDGQDWVYVVSMDGQILGSAPSGHSH